MFLLDSSIWIESTDEYTYGKNNQFAAINCEFSEFDTDYRLQSLLKAARNLCLCVCSRNTIPDYQFLCVQYHIFVIIWRQVTRGKNRKEKAGGIEFDSSLPVN